MKNNQNGRSMIEMLGVLAIIGVLTVGGILGYTKAMSKYRSNKVIDQITLFITNVRTMYAAQQTYVNLSNKLAIDLSLAPDELVVRGSDGKPTGVLRNIFSGNVQIASSSIAEGDDNDNGAFILSFFGLSRDACIAIATSDWGSGSSSGLVGVHYYNDTTGADAAKAAQNTGGAPATGTDEVGTISEVSAADETIDGIYKTANASQADDTSGNYVGIPGDVKVTVPLTVDQAMAACTCRNKATCAASFKYF